MKIPWDSLDLLHVGFGNYVAPSRILAIVEADSAPAKRLVQQKKKTNEAIDATAGRKTKAVIILDNGSIVMISSHPQTIQKRLLTSRLQEDK